MVGVTVTTGVGLAMAIRVGVGVGVVVGATVAIGVAVGAGVKVSIWWFWHIKGMTSHASPIVVTVPFIQPISICSVPHALLKVAEAEAPLVVVWLN